MSPPEGTYTPWYRRFFTNERERELQETRALYDRLAKHPLPDFKTTFFEVMDRLEVPDPFLKPFYNAVGLLLAEHQHMFALPTRDFIPIALKEFVDYRNALLATQKFIEANHAPLETLTEFIHGVFSALLQYLPARKSLLPSPSRS